MIWLLLFAADAPAQTFTPATARNASEWLSSDDYLLRAVGTEKTGVTQVDILIDPVGKALTCGVAGSSGSSDLDVRTCAAAIQRGRFSPAMDDAGRPTYGIYRFRAVWLLLGNDSRMLLPDVILEVPTLPAGRHTLSLSLGYAVNEDGRITSCRVLRTSGYPAYDAAACAAMPHRYRFAPARDKSGKAVSVIRTQLVGFHAAD